jgi:hypothetical protein
VALPVRSHCSASHATSMITHRLLDITSHTCFSLQSIFRFFLSLSRILTFLACFVSFIHNISIIFQLTVLAIVRPLTPSYSLFFANFHHLLSKDRKEKVVQAFYLSRSLDYSEIDRETIRNMSLVTLTLRSALVRLISANGQ